MPGNHLSKPKGFFDRLTALAALSIKLATGRYGESFWTRERRRFLEEYPRLSERNPSDEALHLRAADFFHKEGEGSEALVALRRAAAANPANAETHMRLGTGYLYRKEYGPAGEILDGLKAAGCRMPELFRERARLREETGEFRLALEELEQALGLSPKDVRLLCQRARVYVALESYARALEDAEAALRLDRADREARFALGKISRLLKDLDRAWKIFDSLKESGWRRAELFFERAALCSERGESDRAVEELEAALRIDPAYQDARLAAGRLRHRRQEFALAREAFDRLAADGCRRPELFCERARLCADQGELDRAVEEIETALRIDPAHQDARLAAGRLRHRRKEYPLAREYFDRLKADGCLRPDLFCESAKLYAERGEVQRAFAEIETARRLAPADARVFYERGQLREKAEQHDGALEDFLEALRFDPGHQDAQLAAGEIYLKRKDLERAGQLFDSLKEKGCPRVELRRESASLLRQKKEYREALRELAPLLAQEPGDHQALFEAAKNHQALGEHEQAVRFCRKALTLDSGPGQGPWAGNESYREFLVNRILAEEELFRGEICQTRPIRMSVLLTNRCNLACVMCSQRIKPKDSLTREDVERLRPAMPFLEEISWQGGEAFLSDYLRELLLWTHREYPWIRQAITTNGTLIDEQWAALLARLDVQMTFSIDSVVRENYEGIRVGAEFAGLQKSLGLMREHYRREGGEPRFSMNFIVMKRNLNELGRIPEFCAEFGIRDLFLQKLFPDQVPEEEVLSEELFRSQLRRALPGVEEECRRRGIHLHTCFVDAAGPGPGLNSEAPEESPLSEELPAPRCAEPWTNIHIEFNGDVRPNCACRMPVGNLRADSLENLWNGPEFRRFRRGIMRGRGDRCHSDCVSAEKQAALDNPFYRPR